MTLQEEDAQDANVPRMALQALAAPTQRARRGVRTLVYVKDGQLIRQGPTGDIVLKAVPRRIRVQTRAKKSKS
jgi:hypothetical protein